MPFITAHTPADRIYGRLIPLQAGDEDAGFPLYGLVEALTVPQDPLEPVVREDDTHPAWARAVDPYEAPLWVLPWLALMVGVQWKAASSELLRDKIIERPNYRRGTVPAIESATKVTLTGTKTVFVGIVPGQPWTMAIGTLASESPDPTWTFAQILSEKPAGMVLEAWVNLAGWTYLRIWATYPSYTALNSTFATYTAMNAGP